MTINHVTLSWLWECTLSFITQHKHRCVYRSIVWLCTHISTQWTYRYHWLCCYLICRCSYLSMYTQSDVLKSVKLKTSLNQSKYTQYLSMYWLNTFCVLILKMFKYVDRLIKHVDQLIEYVFKYQHIDHVDHIIHVDMWYIDVHI